MEIELATEMGFCFGVRRAIRLAEKAVRERASVASLGAIVHNRQVVNRLASQGLQTVDTLDAVKGDTLLIPSHGLGPEITEEARARNLDIIDTTCPIVRKAQTAARRMHHQGYQVIVFGDASHPEVKGVLSWAGPSALAVLEAPGSGILQGPVGILSQTTQSEAQFAGFLGRFFASRLPALPEVRIFNTICHATAERQAAAMKLATNVDLMLVIGGHDSANTRHLAEICSAVGVPTFHLETAADLDPSWFLGKGRIGVTAGASTPDWIIAEAVERLQKLPGS